MFDVRGHDRVINGRKLRRLIVESKNRDVEIVYGRIERDRGPKPCNSELDIFYLSPLGVRTMPFRHFFPNPRSTSVVSPSFRSGSKCNSPRF